MLSFGRVWSTVMATTPLWLLGHKRNDSRPPAPSSSVIWWLLLAEEATGSGEGTAEAVGAAEGTARAHTTSGNVNCCHRHSTHISHGHAL